MTNNQSGRTLPTSAPMIYTKKTQENEFKIGFISVKLKNKVNKRYEAILNSILFEKFHDRKNVIL